MKLVSLLFNIEFCSMFGIVLNEYLKSTNKATPAGVAPILVPQIFQ